MAGFLDIVTFIDNEHLRESLFDAQMLSYKVILPTKLQDEPIPMQNDVIDPLNGYFQALIDAYSNWDAESVREQLAAIDTVLTTVVISTVKCGGKKSIKQNKRKSSRVYKEVRKMYKANYYGIKCIELENALLAIHKAYRESFIIVRKVLRPEIYQSLPDSLFITLISGKHYAVKELFDFDEVVQKFRIKKDISISMTDLRLIQLHIAPYIFSVVHNDAVK